MSKIRILLVDDEEDFRTPIGIILKSNGMEVVEADRPSQMDTILQQYAPDVILLDVNLPEESGFDIAKRLKLRGNYSIVMLTAYGCVEDRVEGLLQGADYYLPKPVDTRELIAVIKNLYQHHHPAENEPAQWQLNTTAWTLTTPDKTCHELNKAELAILTELAHSQGEAVSRTRLYAALGLPDYAPESRSLDIQVSRLRKRFTTNDFTIPIKTVHSIGYLFNAVISVISHQQ